MLELIRSIWILPLSKSETPGGAFACPGALSVRSRVQAVTAIGLPNEDTMISNLNQQPLNEQQKSALVRALSEPRLATYLTASGHDWDRAWRMYVWNAQLGESFHILLQTVEVGLRNCTDVYLTEQFGVNWATSQAFKAKIYADQTRDLDTVVARINKRKQPLINGQIVAGLSFGFWVALLQKRYRLPLWAGSRNIQIAFPHLPQHVKPNELASRSTEILSLRNRIFHHEPIFKRNISQDYSDIIDVIRWICPTTCDLVRSECRVPTIMRGRPK